MTDFKNLLLNNKHTLIVSLPANDPELARISWQEGADAVKLHINVAHRASGSSFGSFQEEQDVLKQVIAEAKGPCGIVPGTDVGVIDVDYKHVIDAGFSFLSMYAHHMPVSLVNEGSVNTMAALDNTYDLAYLKYLENIGIDICEASIACPETYGDRLSAAELMIYNRICQNTNLPVVVPTQRNILPCEVANLAACGVNATMIGAIVTGKTPDSIRRAVAEFKNAIEKI
ncbi:MAG: hypothetical protein FWD05_03830 [Oscillospiraceae bacterium]|nr:hypothetical protein [Oscillospiraceae bacterium]